MTNYLDTNFSLRESREYAFGVFETLAKQRDHVLFGGYFARELPAILFKAVFEFFVAERVAQIIEQQKPLVIGDVGILEIA